MRPNNLKQYRNKAQLSQEALAMLLSKKAINWKKDKQKISAIELSHDPTIYIANVIVLILNEYITCTFEDVFPYYIQRKWEKQK